MQHADVVVVGAGVAGLTAAMIAASHGVSTLVLEQLVPGGQVATIEKIRNFPGFPDGIAGYEIGPLLQQQAEAAGAVVELDTVSAVAGGDDGGYRLICGGGEITARTVIVAAGSAPRNLDIAGENEFLGRGVSHCASCDGPLFKDQPVTVVGGGDSAFDEALVLAGFASEVTVVHREPAPTARASAVERLSVLPNVKIVGDAELMAIEGETRVSEIAIRYGGEIRRQSCRAVFAYVGLKPRTQFLRGVVKLDAAGHVMTDMMMRTSRPGIFAAGDIRAGAVNLLAAAVGDAATAAIGAVRYLQEVQQNNNMNGEGNSLGVGRSRSATIL